MSKGPVCSSSRPQSVGHADSRRDKANVKPQVGLTYETVDYPYSSTGNWMDEGKGLVEIDKDFGWLKEY